MLRIGEFSTLTRLSVRMLRHYDAHGILSPATTDETTGYRFYEARQVREATLVRRLRDVGFSVSAIAALLPLRDDPEVLGRALAVQRDQLIADAREARSRVAAIDQLITITRRAIMADITITTHPAQFVVALRRRVDTYHNEAEVWEQFTTAAREQALAFADGPCGATYHDEEYRESDVEIEVWRPVPAGTTATAPLIVRELPERRVGVATIRGDYSQLGDTIAEIVEYLAQAGHQVAGPIYNRYLVSPADTRDPAEYVTEVCLSIA